MDYTIHINDTPQKKKDFVIVIIDDEHKTSSAFAFGKKERSASALKLIKSALSKIKKLNKG